MEDQQSHMAKESPKVERDPSPSVRTPQTEDSEDLWEDLGNGSEALTGWYTSVTISSKIEVA